MEYELMDSPKMPVGMAPFKIKKILVPENPGPDTEPLFVNFFDISQVGTDVYIDVGLVSPEQLIANVNKAASNSAGSAGGDTPVMEFVVSERLAMSINSLYLLNERLREILEHIGRNSSPNVPKNPFQS